MGRKAYSSRNYSHPEQMSRMEKDLSTSSHNPPLNGHSGEMIRRILPKGRVPHICVVGAGMSGLRCAEVLTQHGMKVTILEARDRIGGRVSNRCEKRREKLTLKRFTRVLIWVIWWICKLAWKSTLSVHFSIVLYVLPKWLYYLPILTLMS